MAFQSKVRTRVLKLYDDIASGKVTLTRKTARVLFMTLEHEAFHAEASCKNYFELRSLANTNIS
jgi:L-histidine Nalpha-methyltransferase / hercynylcysteine S-oxide synthase